MKILIALLLALTFAFTPADTAHAQRCEIVMQAWPTDPPAFPNPLSSVLIFAEKVPVNALSWRVAYAPGGPLTNWHEFAYWGCHPEPGWFLASYPAWFHQAFFAMVQPQCHPDFAPAFARRRAERAADWYEGFDGPIASPPRNPDGTLKLKLKQGRTLSALRRALSS